MNSVFNSLNLSQIYWFFALVRFVSVTVSLLGYSCLNLVTS